jgi:hypothetical protein
MALTSTASVGATSGFIALKNNIVYICPGNPATGLFGEIMKHHKYHQHYQVKAAKLHARAEAALDLITALVIGIGLAAVLVYGWTL